MADPFVLMKRKPWEWPVTFIRHNGMKPVVDYWKWCKANDLTPMTKEALRVWVKMHYALKVLRTGPIDLYTTYTTPTLNEWLL